MDLSLTEEQSELLSWADTVLPTEFTLDRFNGVEGPLNEVALEKLAELGWFGLAIPEEVGGSGLSIIEEMLLMKAAGQFLPSPALLATIIAAHAAAEESDKDKVSAVISLEQRAAIALPATDGEINALETHNADAVVLFDADGLVLLPIDDLSALESKAASLDDSLMFARFAVTEGAGKRYPAGSPLWIRAHILLAGLLVGAGEGAMNMAVEYAKIREQFGKPIGTFQAIKHKCSNMALHLTAARSQMIYAAAAFNEGMADAEFRTMSACSLAESSATAAVFDNLQIHGGIGFTSECHAQRFVKRVTVLRMAGGIVKRHRGKLLAGPPATDLLESA